MNKLAITVSAAALLLGSVAIGIAADSDRGKSESARRSLKAKARAAQAAPPDLLRAMIAMI